MFNRLETIAKNLSERIVAANSIQLKEASIVACKLAIQATCLDFAIILESLEQIQQEGSLTKERVAELNDLVALLDDKYFDIQEKAGDNQDLQTEALCFFRQARAVSALSFVCEEDPITAANECIYEAAMAFDDRSEFFSVIEDIISK